MIPIISNNNIGSQNNIFFLNMHVFIVTCRLMAEVNFLNVLSSRSPKLLILVPSLWLTKLCNLGKSLNLPGSLFPNVSGLKFALYFFFILWNHKIWWLPPHSILLPLIFFVCLFLGFFLCFFHWCMYLTTIISIL